jgi:putative ABC transport system permease protein
MILTIFASILLYIGTSVVLDLKTFLEDKNEELNGSDFSVLAPIKYDEEIDKVINEMGQYTQFEKVDAIVCASTFKNLTKNEKGQAIGGLILNADSIEKISKCIIIDEGEEKLPNSIILPYYLKVVKGYKTGDEISITYEGNTHTFIVHYCFLDIIFEIGPHRYSIYNKIYYWG